MIVLWLLAACVEPPSGPPVGPVDIATPDRGWLRGDLHFHTNYSGDARDQGGDWMAGALAIADAWRDPAWVAAHPELSPHDHLQFVAVTDHRTVQGLSDPDFAHDDLVLVRGEEFGGDGHAGIWGLSEHVPHGVQGDESAAQRMRDAVDEAHAQGALFSVNHPMYSGDLWGWPVDTVDAVEVWNGPWSMLAAEIDEAFVDDWVAGHGTENPAIRPASRAEGVGKNGQALRFWEALLAHGLHPAPVGGGDRHMVLPAGLPTTYVRAVDRSEQGILDGIAAGHTFVSRSPQGPQVVLTAYVDGEAFPMGSALPAADEVTLRWRVGRAAGGVLRLVGGPVDPSLPSGEVLAELPVDGERAAGTWTWAPPEGGGWLYPVVVDPLPEPPEGLDTEALTTLPDDAGVAALLGAVGPLIDLDPLGNPAAACDPARWEPDRMQCMPVDTEPLGTFYVPPSLQPWLAVAFDGGVSTGWSMGAIGAAFVAPSR